MVLMTTIQSPPGFSCNDWPIQGKGRVDPAPEWGNLLSHDNNFLYLNIIIWYSYTTSTNLWLKKETVLYRCYCIVAMIQIWPIRDLIWPPMSAKYVKINPIPSIFLKLNWNYLSNDWFPLYFLWSMLQINRITLQSFPSSLPKLSTSY